MTETKSTELDIDLFSTGLARGTALHLIVEGNPTTLCGRSTGTNPRYLMLGSKHVGPSENATCTRCLRAATR